MSARYAAALCLGVLIGSASAETLTLPPQHRPEWLQRDGIVMAGRLGAAAVPRPPRRGAGYTPTPEQRAAYSREHSPEMVARLKALGVNFVMIHCYKGAGLQAERREHGRCRPFAGLLPRGGSPRGRLHHQRHHALGTFLQGETRGQGLGRAGRQRQADHLRPGAPTVTTGTAIIRTPRPTTRRSSALPSKRSMRTCCTSTITYRGPVGTPTRWSASAVTWDHVHAAAAGRDGCGRPGPPVAAAARHEGTLAMRLARLLLRSRWPNRTVA